MTVDVVPIYDFIINVWELFLVFADCLTEPISGIPAILSEYSIELGQDFFVLGLALRLVGGLFDVFFNITEPILALFGSSVAPWSMLLQSMSLIDFAVYVIIPATFVTMGFKWIVNLVT